MIIPSTRVFTAGEVETGAYLNATVTNLGNFLLGKPIFHAYQTVAQTLTSGSYAPITFTTEIIDRDNGHSNTTNTSRYTANTAGYYLFNGAVQFAANGTGVRSTLWQVNGTTPANGMYTASTPQAANSTTTVASPFLIYLSVGDYVQLAGFQSSGGNLNTIAAAAIYSYMTAIWVSV